MYVFLYIINNRPLRALKDFGRFLCTFVCYDLLALPYIRVVCTLYIETFKGRVGSQTKTIIFLYFIIILFT